MASPIGEIIEETNQGEEEENLTFELNDGPNGLSSLRKLMKGFCGGGLFGGDSGFDLPPDSLQNSRHNPVSTVLPKAGSLKQEGSSNRSPSGGDNACNDTLATSESSVASAPEEKPSTCGSGEVKTIEVEDQGDSIEIRVVTEEKIGTEDEEVVKHESDDTAQRVDNTTAAEKEEEAIVSESTNDNDDDNSSSSFGVLFILCCVLLAFATTVVPEFREQGLEKLDLYIQNAVETELVQSTQKLVNVDEIAKEVIEESQSKNKKITKRVKKNKKEASSSMKQDPLQEQVESPTPKTQDSESKSKVLASLEDAMEKQKETIQGTTQDGSVVSTNLVQQKKDEDDSVKSKEKRGNQSKAENKTEASAKKNDSTKDDNIAKESHANTFQRPAFVRPPSKEKERASDGQDEL